MHPSKGEAVNWAEATAEVGGFAAGFRNHRTQFGERKRAKDGKNRADDPGRKNDGDAASFAGHFGRLQEDAGANHCADNDGRGGPGAQPANEFETFFGHVTSNKVLVNRSALANWGAAAAVAPTRETPQTTLCGPFGVDRTTMAPITKVTIEPSMKTHVYASLGN